MCIHVGGGVCCVWIMSTWNSQHGIVNIGYTSCMHPHILPLVCTLTSLPLYAPSHPSPCMHPHILPLVCTLTCPSYMHPHMLPLCTPSINSKPSIHPITVLMVMTHNSVVWLIDVNFDDVRPQRMFDPGLQTPPQDIAVLPATATTSGVHEVGDDDTVRG